MNNIKLIKYLIDLQTKLRKSYLDRYKLKFDDIVSFYERMGYVFFKDNGKNYNLNIFGIRSADLTPGVYNDTIGVAWEYGKTKNLYVYKATTDPGLYYLNNPINIIGTAVLVPGQYRGVYMLGTHRKGTKFEHRALVQVKPMRYWRVKDYDNYSQLPIDEGEIYEEIAMTNLHSKPRGFKETDDIGRDSAGCQVIAEVERYHTEFLKIVEEAAKVQGNRFTYTLFYEPTLLIQ